MLVKTDFYLVVAAVGVCIGTDDRTVAEGAMAHAVALLVLRERFRLSGADLAAGRSNG